MGRRNRFDENAWYVDFIMGLVGIFTSIFLHVNYESYLQSYTREMPSGKGAKLFMVVVKVLDNVGGKLLAIGVVVFFSFLFLFWAYRKYQKRHLR